MMSPKEQSVDKLLFLLHSPGLSFITAPFLLKGKSNRTHLSKNLISLPFFPNCGCCKKGRRKYNKKLLYLQLIFCVKEYGMKKGIGILGIFLVLLLIGFVFNSRTPAQSSIPTKAYFSPEGGAEKALLTAIRSARKEILVAIYIFTSRPLSSALIQAHSRGVKVTLLIDGKERNAGYAQGSALEKKGIEVRYVWPKGSNRDSRVAKFHHKYMVIDGKVVITGSFNYTRAADQINHENLLIIASRPLAKSYRANFVKIYKDESITKKSRSRSH